MRTSFGFAEKMCTAGTAKPPMHVVATIGQALKIGEFTFNNDRVSFKTSVDGSATGTDILAKATPTYSRHDGGGSHLVANGAAQTSSGDQHGTSFDSV